jgi:hypothetical protein
VIRWTTPVSRKRITYQTERVGTTVTKGDRVDDVLLNVRKNVSLVLTKEGMVEFSRVLVEFIAFLIMEVTVKRRWL